MKPNHFYDGGPLLGMTDIRGEKPEIYISSTNRTGGKTTYFNRYALKKFRESGEHFMLLYRYQNELEEVADRFFGDIKGLFFPGITMRSVKMCGGKYVRLEIAPDLPYENEKDIPWELCGFATALSAYDFIKKNSHRFTTVKRIILDEFQPEDGRYLKDEPAKLMSIHTSLARGQGKQVRYLPVIMICNPVSMVNPYYLAMQITHRLDTKTRFLKGDGFVMEQGYVESAAKSAQESPFNRAFKNLSYAAYSAQGVYLNSNLAFVERMSGPNSYYCGLLHDSKKYSIRLYHNQGIFYMASGWDESHPLKFSSSELEHNENTTMLSSFSTLVSTWKRAFEKGVWRFQNIDAKYALISLFYTS